MNTYDILGDSGEYEYLTEAVELSKDVDGVCCEIGLRMGLGTKTIIDAVRQFCPTKTVISIDPYGSILYQGREMNEPCRLDYTNDMKYRCLSALYAYLVDNPVDYHYYDVEDTVFFERYAKGIEKYDLDKNVLNTYSMVHFDGPHHYEAIKHELLFFNDRMASGATIIVDDITIDFIDIKPVNELFIKLGWTILKQGAKKGLYQKK